MVIQAIHILLDKILGTSCFFFPLKLRFHVKLFKTHELRNQITNKFILSGRRDNGIAGLSYESWLPPVLEIPNQRQFHHIFELRSWPEELTKLFDPLSELAECFKIL